MMRWVLAFCLLSPEALAEPAAERRPEKRLWHAPDHVKLQSGGYLGLATIGVGLAAFHDHFNATGYYGWVPRSIAGTEIHSFALTLSGRAPRIRLGASLDWVPLYLGGGALITSGDGFFVLLPDRYPSGYYPQNAVRTFVLSGTELELRKHASTGFSGHAAFVELVALDLYLHHWAENRSRISFIDVVSIGAGYKARLP